MLENHAPMTFKMLQWDTYLMQDKTLLQPGYVFCYSQLGTVAFGVFGEFVIGSIKQDLLILRNYENPFQLQYRNRN